MNKESGPILILSCILLLLGIAAYAVSGGAQVVPGRILMQNTQGHVVFTHKAHTAYGLVAGCATCHHEIAVTKAVFEKREAGIGAPEGADFAATTASAQDIPTVFACGTCHNAARQEGFAAAHAAAFGKDGGKTCVACHHTVFTGYADKWSHEEHTAITGDDCSVCHHDPESTGRDPDACASCHIKGSPAGGETGVTLKDAAHAKCIGCHEDIFADRLQGCGFCHASAPAMELLQANPAEKSWAASCAPCHGELPAGMDAQHGSCFSCHEKAGKGPDAEKCAQCHTK